MIKARYLIGFTGHRSGFDEAVIRRELQRLFTGLQQQATTLEGQLELYCSVAEGADVVCVETARQIGMPVHLIIPLSEAEFEKDFTSPVAWRQTKNQIDISASAVDFGSLSVLADGSDRPDCYFNQAIRMLDAVDILVAVWDQKPAQGRGGTAHVVDYARRVGIPVIQIHPETGVTSGMGNILTKDPVLEELNRLTGREQDLGVGVDSTPDEIQKRLGEKANREAARFRPSALAIILLHGVASLLAAMAAYHPAHETDWLHTKKTIIGGVELLLVCSALWMGWRLHRQHSQNRWIQYRFAAEMVRGLRAAVPLMNPLHPIVEWFDPAWKRFAISVGLLIQKHAAGGALTQWRDHYVQTRLSGTHAEGQVRHFQKKFGPADWWWRATGIVTSLSALLAPVFVALALANKLAHTHFHEAFWGWIMVVFLPIGLPLVASVAGGLRQALDAGRRKVRYKEMAARLVAVQNQLEGLETRATIERVVTRGETLLLHELREWQLSVTNASLH